MPARQGIGRAPHVEDQTEGRDLLFLPPRNFAALHLARHRVAAAGLAILLCVGSPQSREGDEPKEAKIDAILKAVDKGGTKTIASLDRIQPSIGLR